MKPIVGRSKGAVIQNPACERPNSAFEASGMPILGTIVAEMGTVGVVLGGGLGERWRNMPLV